MVDRAHSLHCRTGWLLVVCAAVLVWSTLRSARAQDDRGDAVIASPADVTAAILPLHGTITDVTVDSLKRRIDDARGKGATIVVFDLDTPGGLVTSSIAVADLIKNLPEVKTVAWINPNAHSGGSIVAVACDEIVMARSSRMGDSQVIMLGPTGADAIPEELRPKAYTPVLHEFRASARLNGYDQVLCEAFVLPDREVWWLENTETGERKFVFRDEKLKLLGETEDRPVEQDDQEDKSEQEDQPADEATKTETKEAGDAAKESEWKLVETYYDPLLEMDVDTIQPVVAGNQLLEMSASEAQAYGFSKGVVADEGALRERYGITTLVRISPSGLEVLASWLTSVYVRGFLMLIILLGAYVEFHTPGVGVPGVVALICLAIFVGAPYLTGLANVWEILLIVVGLGLIALEVLVIPGFGVAGILGIALVITGLLATFVPPEPGRSLPLYLPSLPSTMHALRVAIITVVSSMAASLIGMVILSRFLPRIPVFRHVVPANPTPSDVLTDDPYRGAARVGDTGVAEGPLHPAGKARFGAMLVDVVTQGEYLDKDTRVEVIERRGYRVVVRPVA